YTNTKSIVAFELTKTADPTTYSSVGQLITYTYTLKNTGNVPAAGPFTVSDDKLGPISCGSGPLTAGASANCLATHAVTQADLDAGAITNTATFSGGGLTSAVTATATVTAVQAKSALLTKTASPASYSAVGQEIAYTYSMKNTG